ncbi:MAG TPA: hypothetical protein VD833_15655 [Vicinamibacterales bacterium]|nr:hypothetical protein [Vicinamibacterales bacterium]
MTHVLLAALALGALSTFGDFVWAALELRHRMGYGLAHGAAICLAIGAAVGLRHGRTGAGAAAGPVIGLAAAGGFYLLAPWLRYSAMFPMWMFFWICFALLQARLGPERSLAMAFARGLIAAVLSGLAFYAISGIWTRPAPGGPDYLRHFLSWTIAFLPGFAALFLFSPRGSRRV